MTANRIRHLVVLLAAVAFVAAACGSSGSDAAGDTTAAPADLSVSSVEFTADLLSGGEFDAASLEGKNTVLWFWAPWCTVCRAEAPDVVEAAGDFDGDVDVIGVAGRGEVAEMNSFLDDTGTGGLEHLVDADGSIWSKFGVAAQPSFAFIDDSGEVEVVIGAMGHDAIAERMQELVDA